jgi:hypothetical protein
LSIQQQKPPTLGISRRRHQCVNYYERARSRSLVSPQCGVACAFNVISGEQFSDLRVSIGHLPGMIRRHYARAVDQHQGGRCAHAVNLDVSFLPAQCGFTAVLIEISVTASRTNQDQPATAELLSQVHEHATLRASLRKNAPKRKLARGRPCSFDSAGGLGPSHSRISSSGAAWASIVRRLGPGATLQLRKGLDRRSQR